MHTYDHLLTSHICTVSVSALDVIVYNAVVVDPVLCVRVWVGVTVLCVCTSPVGCPHS